MTRKKNNRRNAKNRRNFVAIPFTAQITLSTLASVTAILTTTIATLAEDLFIISVDALWSLRDLTPGEGPIEVGFAHDDLTVAEVQEALNAELVDPDDIITRERARRPVRRVGIFSGLGESETLNDGRVLRQAIKFMIGDGHTLNCYALNRSGATLTTGAIVHINGTIFGRWQR